FHKKKRGKSPLMHIYSRTILYRFVRQPAVWSVLLCAPWLCGANTCGLKNSDLPEASAKKTYAQNAKAFYDAGQKDLKNGDVVRARRIFRKLKTAYPFSRYAVLAELGIADCAFQSNQYLQSIDLYGMFAKLHPSHPQHAYAVYRIALSHFKQRPWEFFLIPPAYEKDSSITQQAIRAYQRFLYAYPNHKLAKKAKEELKTCVQQLAQHEIEVAKFYAKRKKYQAVIWRMEYMLKNYPLAEYDALAHVRIASAQVQLKRYQKAYKTLQMVLKKYPKSRQKPRAQKLFQRVSVLLKKTIQRPPSKRKVNVPVPPRVGPVVPKPRPRPQDL
ncbi:MAG: outer membrane protein assembly factor BamD, partial [Myxococcota bacterium]